MDMNETAKKMKSRHPWELSRTKCVLKSMDSYLTDIHRNGEKKRYLNIGAGDMYFDRALMKKWKKDALYAVDIGYAEQEKQGSRVHKYKYLEEIEENNFDYALMMDSLEYMEDEVEYVKKLCGKLKPGGMIFFTLPSFQKLFSEHDVIVKLLRRYDRKSFARIIDEIPEIEIVEEHFFYFSLLCVRCLQKWLHLPIDPKHEVTTGWRFEEKGIVTKLVTGFLNLDYRTGAFLNKHNIWLPGLSLFIVCRKDNRNE